MEGAVKKLSKKSSQLKPQTLFLFSDLLLCCKDLSQKAINEKEKAKDAAPANNNIGKKYKVKHTIPIKLSLTRNLTDSASTYFPPNHNTSNYKTSYTEAGLRYGMEVLKVDDHTNYHFYFNTNEEKLLWMQRINEATLNFLTRGKTRIIRREIDGVRRTFLQSAHSKGALTEEGKHLPSPPPQQLT